MSDDLVDYLPVVTLQHGSTSYFSTPDTTLDPALFDGTSLRPDVRSWILNTLYAGWNKHFQNAVGWSRVWIAGSGASYQWSAAREPGDLDVLIGVDYVKFRRSNPDLDGLGDTEISEYLNDVSRAELYPKTANATVGGKVFEVTWYVNPGATDIRAIHPYAAYDVTGNRWTVEPDHSPHAPTDPEWQRAAQEDAQRANDIVGKYLAAIRAFTGSTNLVHRVNAKLWLNEAAQAARDLFEEIHTGRRVAFGPGGQGYSDYHNYRWQAGKASGAVQALNAIRQGLDAYEEARQRATYGEPLEAADKLLRRAMTARRPM